MISFVTFKWRQPGYPVTYTGAHVARWVRHVSRHYQGKRKFYCITDDLGDLPAGVIGVPLWDDWSNLSNRHGEQYPSCYRRLRLWSSDIADLLGNRIVLMDLDCAIVGDLTPLIDRKDDVVLWRDPNPPFQYNGGFLMLDAGARPAVWDGFDARTIKAAERYRGSDQAILTHMLGTGESVWTEEDGVMSYKKHVRRHFQRTGRAPDHARIIFFHGNPKPWEVGF